ITAAALDVIDVVLHVVHFERLVGRLREGNRDERSHSRNHHQSEGGCAVHRSMFLAKRKQMVRLGFSSAPVHASPRPAPLPERSETAPAPPRSKAMWRP